MIGSPDSLWKGPIPFLLGVIGPFSYVLPLAIWLVLLSEPLFGTSPGKFLFRLKICKTDGKQAKLKEKWIRHASKTSPLWILILALLVGSWQVAVISVFALVVILPGFFLLLGPQKMAIHDSLSKTGVFWIGARV